MPSIYQTENQHHTEEMQDIISAPPSWLLRWGISLFFGILVVIIALSFFIRYPDMVKTQLVISSLNSPKPIVAKFSGRLIKLLISDNEKVLNDEPLAYLESTARHKDVLNLFSSLKILKKDLTGGNILNLQWLNSPGNLQLGELQTSYESFYGAYLLFKASSEKGFNLKKRIYLQKELASIQNQKKQLLSRKALQDKDYDLARQEYNMHQELTKQKVEAIMELKREESKLLAKKFPLQEMETELLNNSSTYLAKEKELMELNNQIEEEQSKFRQSLNSMISQTQEWKNKYVLSASQKGKAAFSGIVQENQFVEANQELFYINPGNGDFFGQMAIPQDNMGKVKTGQRVLIKLRSYPFEEYGMMQGKISYISDIPYKDSIFISKVNFLNSRYSEMKRPVTLKNGMTAQADIITEDASLMHRVSRSLVKMLK